MSLVTIRSRQVGRVDRGVEIDAKVSALLAAGSPVAIAVSGGKDSVAAAFATVAHLDAIGHTGPRILIHSDLGRVEWKDSLPTCERLAAALGIELVVVRRAAGGASGTDFALAVPYMIHRSNGERPGQDPRTYDVRAPHPTVVAGGLKTAVVTAFVAKSFSDRRDNEVQGIDIDRPITTVTGQDHHSLVAASLVKYRGTSDAHLGSADITEPVHTISAGGDRGGIHAAVQAAFLARYNGERRDGEEPRGSALDEPASTLDASNRLAVTAAFLTKFQQNSTGQDVREPQHTVMAGASRFGVVEAPMFDGAAEWSPEIERRARRVYDFLIVEGIIGPWLDHDAKIVRLPGTELVVYDIGMRMLVPRELFRAQGFSDSYVIELMVGRKRVSKTEQVRLAGNSVCPDVAEALIRAALRDPCTTRLDHEQLELRLAV